MDGSKPKRVNATTRGGLVAAIVAYGVARGISEEKFEAATKLKAKDLLNAESRVPEDTIGLCWNVLGEAFPGRPIALEMAESAPFSYIGPLAYMVQFSSSIGEIMETFMRYSQLMSDGLDIRWGPDTDPRALVCRHDQDAVDGGYGMEASLAIAWRLNKEILCIDHSVVGFEFAGEPHGPIELYEEWFGRPVRFSAGRSALLIDPSTLDDRPNAANAGLYDFFDKQMHSLSEALDKADPLFELRSAILDNAKRGKYSLDDLAETMGIGVRTLQRSAEGLRITLRVLVDDVRLEFSQRYLANKQFSNEDVAFLVGYSDARAFNRAFKRWTGLTPGEYRKSLN